MDGTTTLKATVSVPPPAFDGLVRGSITLSFDRRARPPVQEQQRHRVGTVRLLMDEVDVEAADVGLNWLKRFRRRS
jgi:hypothetical protein